MARVRLGVALLIPPPLGAEIDGLRRALGDGALGRIPAHLTLVPPVNVREDRLGEALAVLRRAAAATRPFTVSLGPPATFLPDNPTLHLIVAEETEVRALRDRVFVDPLARALTWPFVPHVTLADGADPERIEAALVALVDYSATVTFDRVHLLEEGEQRTWHPLADCPLGPPDLVGRGGFEVELTTTDLLDPEAGQFLESHGVTLGGPPYVVARHRWAVVGVATADEVLVSPEHEAHGIAELLARRRDDRLARGPAPPARQP